jgi:hypothetical protein
VLQGLGAALILAIIEQVRDRDEQSRAAASAEARALQARMNPHFLGSDASLVHARYLRYACGKRMTYHPIPLQFSSSI